MVIIFQCGYSIAIITVPQMRGVRVCSDAVLSYFPCGFVEIFISYCGIEVLQHCSVQIFLNLIHFDEVLMFLLRGFAVFGTLLIPHSLLIHPNFKIAKGKLQKHSLVRLN